MAFLAALSGFRALIADALYIHANVLWERTEWGRMKLDYDAVVALQPRPEVLHFLAAPVALGKLPDPDLFLVLVVQQRQHHALARLLPLHRHITLGHVALGPVRRGLLLGALVGPASHAPASLPEDHTLGSPRNLDPGEEAFTYQHDALGSVVGLADASGDVEATYDYEPFGEDASPPGGPVNPMRFTGEYADDDTGLYHLRARQYDPGVGRFLSTDPLAPALTDPYVSAYVYANNRPTYGVDPSGLRYEMSWREDLLKNPVTVWQTGCRALQEDSNPAGRLIRLLSPVPPNDLPGEMGTRLWISGSLVGARIIDFWGQRHHLPPSAIVRVGGRVFVTATVAATFTDVACRVGA